MVPMDSEMDDDIFQPYIVGHEYVIISSFSMELNSTIS